MSNILLWSPEMAVGHTEIDRQHRQLLDTANMVRTLVDENAADADVLKAALDEVVDYTHAHFAFEEALLAKAGYGDLAAHLAKHQAIRAAVEALAADPTDLDIVKLDTAITALVVHITTVDSEYSGVI